MIDEPRHTHPNDDPRSVQHDTTRPDDRYTGDDARADARDDFAGDDLTRNDMARNEDTARNDTARTDPAHTDPVTGAEGLRPDSGVRTSESMRPDTTVPATESRREAPAAGATHATNGAGNLIPPQRAEEFDARWSAIKGEFVDEPRKAVTDADQLVGDFLDELQQSLNHRRQSIGESLDAESTTTESMRTALHDYRTMIDRLLATESR